MEINRESYPAVISVPLVKSPAHENKVHEHCDLTIYTKFLNYSGMTISIGTRNGVIYDIPQRSDRIRKEFIVRQEIYISDNLKEIVRGRILTHDGLESEDFKEFKRMFLDAFREQDRGVTLKFDHVVSSLEMKHQGGSVYISELDIILSIDKNNIPLHPFCFEALNRNCEVPGGVENGLNVVIVDNRTDLGPRYIRLTGKVVQVKTIVDPHKSDGVYFHYRGMLITSQRASENLVEFVPVEKMDSIPWLYKTFAEAKNSLEGDAQANVELKELELESKRQVSEVLKLKSGLEIEKIELERKNAELQRELDERERERKLSEIELQKLYNTQEHRSKVEQLRTKDYYEERSTTRKDTSELIKFIPSLLMGAATAVLAMRTLL